MVPLRFSWSPVAAARPSLSAHVLQVRSFFTTHCKPWINLKSDPQCHLSLLPAQSWLLSNFKFTPPETFIVYFRTHVVAQRWGSFLPCSLPSGNYACYINQTFSFFSVLGLVERDASDSSFPGWPKAITKSLQVKGGGWGVRGEMWWWEWRLEWGGRPDDTCKRLLHGWVVLTLRGWGSFIHVSNSFIT